MNDHRKCKGRPTEVSVVGRSFTGSEPVSPPTAPEVLCQPDPGKSCGACCGLYNHRDNSRAALVRILRRSTERFRAIGGIDGDLEAYSSRWQPRLNEDKLCREVFNCEYLGFLDEDETRVGCMLHPAGNHGRDLRHRSFYGKDLCAGHLCPSHEKLTPAEKYAVVSAVSSWYLYGLVATDIDLVKAFFHHAAANLGEAPKREWLVHPAARDTLAAFFRLKETWPYRDPAAPRLGKYLFLDGGYVEDRIDYETLGRPPSPYHAILVSLESSFPDAGDLAEAEGRIEGGIERFVEACSTRAGSTAARRETEM